MKQDKIELDDLDLASSMRKKIVQLQRDKSRMQSTVNARSSQIRNMRLRLKKIRGSIDYLLEHPYSSDNSPRGWKRHGRREERQTKKEEVPQAEEKLQR